MASLTKTSSFFNFPEVFQPELESSDDYPFKEAKAIIESTVKNYSIRTAETHPIEIYPELQDMFVFEIGCYILNVQKYYQGKKESLTPFREAHKKILKEKIEQFDLYFGGKISFDDLIHQITEIIPNKIADSRSVLNETNTQIIENQNVLDSVAFLSKEQLKATGPHFTSDLIHDEITVSYGKSSFLYRHPNMRIPKRLISSIAFYRLNEILTFFPNGTPNRTLSRLYELHAFCELHFINMNILPIKIIDEEDPNFTNKDLYSSFINCSSTKRIDADVLKAILGEIEEHLRHKGIRKEAHDLMKRTFRLQYNDLLSRLNTLKSINNTNFFAIEIPLITNEDRRTQILDEEFIPERIYKIQQNLNSALTEELYQAILNKNLFILYDQYLSNQKLFADIFDHVNYLILLQKHRDFPKL